MEDCIRSVEAGGVAAGVVALVFDENKPDMLRAYQVEKNFRFTPDSAPNSVSYPSTTPREAA